MIGIGTRLAGIAGLLLVMTAAGQPGSCPHGNTHVTTPQGVPIAPVCEAVDKATKLLGDCGITPSRPLRVHLVKQLPDNCPGHVLGFFDSQADRLVVATLDTCTTLTRAEYWFGEPMSRLLYRSLLVHELTHAIVEQNLAGKQVGRTAHEYLAYAFQLASMEPDLRSRILHRYDHATPVELRKLNETYLDLSPPDFAVLAYTHFSTPGNGCHFARQLLDQSQTFPEGRH